MADDAVFHVDLEDLQVERPRRQPRIFRPRPNHFLVLRDFEFKRRFRVSKEVVQHLVELIGPQIAPKTNANHAITPDQKILLTLRFYANGNFIITNADFMGVSESRACQIINEVSHHLALHRPQFIHMPQTPEEIRRIQQEFYQLSEFPKVIGSIDCTHVRLQSPGGANAELYRGRKGYFSRNVQCVTGPQLEILDIVTRWHGSTHDQTVFDASAIKRRLEGEEFGNSHIIGDSGYTCTNYLLTPLPEPIGTRGEALYNEALIRTRNSSERTFGVWKRRFPILSTGIRQDNDRVDAIIIACAVLHNIALTLRDEVPLPDPDVQIPPELRQERRVERRQGGAPRPHVPVREHLVRWYTQLARLEAPE